jgi:hypothetical protein
LNNPNRAFLSIETDNFGTWTGWSAGRTVNAAAAEVFNFLGNNNIAYRQRSSGHMLQYSDYPAIWAAIDYLFGQPVHGTETGFRGNRAENQIYVEDVWDVARPGIWDSFSDLSRSPIEVDSSWIRWSRPNAHTLWTDSQIIGEGLPATITAVTTAENVELILWSHGGDNLLWNTPPVELGRWSEPELTRALSGTIRGNMYEWTFELAAEEVQIGRFELVASGVHANTGNNEESRSVFFQSIDSHTALRHGTTRDNVGGGANSTMIGFTSRINPETVRAYQRNAYGEENALSPATHQGGGHWIMPYGVRLGGISGMGSERAHILRGLQFEAMPGFTFELSLQETFHVGDQPPAIWAASPAVQNIGPYPHWRAGGTGARPTAEALPITQNRDSHFNITMQHSFTPADTPFWHIQFSAPLNPRDFGIGFSFSDNFTLSWNENNTELTIYFNNITPRDGSDLTMYIFRARAEDGNTNLHVINTPIRHSKPDLWN